MKRWFIWIIAITIGMASCSDNMDENRANKNISSEQNKKANKQSPLNRELLEAVRIWDGKKVLSLIRKGADVNIKDKYGRSLLHRSLGSLSWTQILIRNGAKVNVRDHGGFRPLDYVEDKILLQAGAQHSVNYLLIQAVKHGDRKKVIELIRKGADGNSVFNSRFYGSSTAIHEAACKGDLEILRILLKNGSDIELKYKYGTPLVSAACCGQIKIVEFLLEHGADINAQMGWDEAEGMNALHCAVSNNEIKMIKYLMKKGIHIDQVRAVGGTPLFDALEEGKMEIVRLLVESGANINTPGREVVGRFDSLGTPLNYAVGKGDISLVRYFIKHGANINFHGNASNSPLHVAAGDGRFKIAQLLISQGARVNAKAWENLSPLHGAARWNHPKLAKLLIKNGADVNAQDDDGKTPLHDVAEGGHRKIAKLLIQKGAKVNIKNEHGKTPLDLAKSETMKKLLKKAGGRSGK